MPAAFRESQRRRAGSTARGLLACPQLDAQRVEGRLVAIVKGEGGRDLLARELAGRGAEVIEANVYRRRAPERLADMLDGVRESIDVVTATSAEALENMLEAAPWTTRWLSDRLLVTVSERVADIARSRSLSRVSVATGADAASIVEATALAVVGSPRTGAGPGQPRIGGRGPMSTEVRRSMEIVNKLGLHARAAAKLIRSRIGFRVGYPNLPRRSAKPMRRAS